MTAAALEHAAAGRARFCADLAEFVRFPSVGADPRRRDDVAACARWLAGRVRAAGVADVEVVRTPGHPIVHAVWDGAPGAPTVLVYGHYDVQPAEPLATWRTPPFDPVVVGEDLVGRGACDDKGPLLCHVAAIESRLATAGRLPVNVVCVFEGEEEHGSPHLPAYLRAQRRHLAADVAVMSDTRMRGRGRPVIVDGTRGALSLEITLARSGDEVHAGQFGGAVANPLDALCRMVAALHDAHGRIAVPGFYRRVRLASPAERARMAREAPSRAEILRDAGTTDAAGEAGWTAYERTTVRPALTVTGLAGGYTGPGAKSAVPARAQARLNLRLVPEQDPAEVEHLVRSRLRALAPAGIELTVRAGNGSRATTIDRRHPGLRAGAEALRESFGHAAVFLRSGGTIPIVADIHELFGAPTVLMGFALPDDGMHAPNEKVNLPTLHRGIAACIRFQELVAARSSSPSSIPTTPSPTGTWRASSPRIRGGGWGSRSSTPNATGDASRRSSPRASSATAFAASRCIATTAASRARSARSPGATGCPSSTT
jgi:acetylornithine deacetylase/succinyl-diaminopimelate desuccinylase-like protein